MLDHDEGLMMQEKDKTGTPILNNKSNIMCAFVLSIVGFISAFIIGFVGIALSGVALNCVIKETDEKVSQPYKTFRIIALPMSIVGLCLGIIHTIIVTLLVFLVSLYIIGVIILYGIIFAVTIVFVIIYIIFIFVAVLTGSATVTTTLMLL